MTAVRQPHGKDAVARFENRKIDCQVGRSSAMGLHVDVSCSEQLFTAFHGQVLKVIGLAAAGMKPPSWVAFGRLEVEGGSLGLQYRKRGVVLGCDQIDCVLDTLLFRLYNPEYFRIIKAQMFHHGTCGGFTFDFICYFNILYHLSFVTQIENRGHPSKGPNLIIE